MSIAQNQLTLRLSPKDIFRLDNFLFSNPELEHAVREFCSLQSVDSLYLWGETGSGKSHLLIAITEQLIQSGHQVVYQSLAEMLSSSSAQVLDTFDHADVICLDDLDAIAGHADWEEALFHCFNRRREASKQIVLASHFNPNQLNIQLADLRSRLATSLVYQLQFTDDNDKQAALMLQAQSRGLQLPEEVAQYLLRRHGRDMPKLMQILQQLDAASLEAQRKLTVPFVRQTLSS